MKKVSSTIIPKQRRIVLFPRNSSSRSKAMLNSRRIPPFFKITLVVLCAFILWSFNHPKRSLSIRSASGVDMGMNIRQQMTMNHKPANAKMSSFRKMTTKCTKPVTNVAFLKTHKTGSSTMSNIMLRFADTHNLTVGLPLKDHWELGGYPAYIDKRLIDPPLPKYNILGHHFRFNIDNLQEIMHEDTRYITIIRAPKDNVESVFGFFVDQSPFNDWLKDVDASTTALRLQTFYDHPQDYYNKNTDWFFRSKNHMFFDIGNDVSVDDDEYISMKIQEMDNTFSLVLITDYFDESLLMLKNVMCWDWDDIVYIKFKMRIEEAKTEVNEELGKKILKWNKADERLYDHFNATFWKQVSEYGFDKMAQDVVLFQEKQKEAENLCIDSYQPFKKKPWILGAKLRPKPSLYCKHLAWSETVYGEFLREKMYDTTEGLSRLTDAQLAARDELFTQVTTGALQKD